MFEALSKPADKDHREDNIGRDIAEEPHPEEPRELEKEENKEPEGKQAADGKGHQEEPNLLVERRLERGDRIDGANHAGSYGGHAG